ncbi:MAG: DUF2924 domain-containing protein [Phycisphaerales bacterium]|nr:DUF2924 domain-containing protein [Phycisphaerales bacterium]
MKMKQEVARLQKLKVPELREEFERLWGEPARSNNRMYLLKRILWRLQALEHGGLTERAQRLALELARDQDLRVRPSTAMHKAFDRAVAEVECGGGDQLPPTGSVLTRVYRGRRVQVRVTQNGFEHEGAVYMSLTAAARAITGSAWNGRLFFGLTQRGNKS